MSDSVQPHRREPTRLPHSWDSPGKNTGVGCHFLLQCMKVKSESEAAQSCLTLCDPMDCSLPGFSVHGIFQARVLEWVSIAFSLEDECSLIHQQSKNFRRRLMNYKNVNEVSSRKREDNCSLIKQIQMYIFIQVQ